MKSIKSLPLKIFLFTLSLTIFWVTDSVANNETLELAMRPGAIVKATNKYGVIKIEAKTQFQRTYSWNGNSIDVTLSPRQYRWNGSLGAYNPSGGRKQLHVVVEEGQQHFCSEQEAQEWLAWQNDRLQYVFSPEGFVVGWSTSRDSNTGDMALSVNVWQFYINGEKPKSLNSGEKKELFVTSTTGVSLPSPLVGKFIPSSPKEINGRLYSGKAIDYMSDKAINLKPSEVEKIITGGTSEKKGIYHFFYQFDGSFAWVMLDQNGRVVLVGT